MGMAAVIYKKGGPDNFIGGRKTTGSIVMLPFE